MIRSLALVFMGVLSAGMLAGGAQAAFVDSELIDFEGLGLVEGDPLTSVTTPANVVTFFTDAGPCYVIEVGSPERGFTPRDIPKGDNAGSVFISDRFGMFADTYYIRFSAPVLSLTLDLYDFRGDGTGGIGDIATLEVFADAAMTVPVGSDSFTVPAPRPPDGNVVTLSVLNPTHDILAASLSYPLDTGTGIDNIRFDVLTAPIPSSLWLLCCGLVGLVGIRRKSTRDC
ncbi:MAG: hypothetical protein SWE60_09920 [Thermodesulfobacteriota bacterium]|nr:hypothetical protein [Thermodesulfobacteriota bacterium]